jgi:hypothetical protein
MTDEHLTTTARPESPIRGDDKLGDPLSNNLGQRELAKLMEKAGVKPNRRCQTLMQIVNSRNRS